VEQQLRALADSGRPILAGPWLGEVGFELLYWVPFLAWVAEHFGIGPERITVMSRGGSSAWYGGFASGYHDAFDSLSRAEFRRQHDERVREFGEQKQVRISPFERDLVEALPGGGGLAILHPSTMYELMSPFWWGHVDETWVFRHARYRLLSSPVESRVTGLERGGYVAVKFYFNDGFPENDRTRAFARAALRDLAADGPVVSLTTGLDLDDHEGVDLRQQGVTTLAGLSPRENLGAQSAVVAGARAFVGTYGGFSYLAPFHGVPATAYYADAGGFSQRHLTLARAALASIGKGDLLQVKQLQFKSVG
jgi:hypothetical protein